MFKNSFLIGIGLALAAVGASQTAPAGRTPAAQAPAPVVATKDDTPPPKTPAQIAAARKAADRNLKEARGSIARAEQAEGKAVLDGRRDGTDAEIATFCSTQYDVHFPLFSKISVKGPARHPLYVALTHAIPAAEGEGAMRKRLADHGIQTGAADEVLWNFEKFLVGRNGAVAARFAPDVAPDDPRLLAAIDRELAQAA